LIKTIARALVDLGGRHGRAWPGATAVRVEGPGAPRDVRVGEAGAFLLLYGGRVAANEVRVTPR
jgi:hypothetical protein